MKIFWKWLLVSAVIVLVVSCNNFAGNNSSSSSASSLGPNSVSMGDNFYNPSSLTVAVGTTVTWINNGSANHTVTTTSAPQSFDSGLLAPGSSFTHTFGTAGTYNYLCTIHGSMMSGTVTATN